MGNQWLNSKTQEMQKIAELKKKQEELKKLEMERRNNRKSISDSVYNAWLKSKDEAKKNKSKDTKNVAKSKKGRSKSFEDWKNEKDTKIKLEQENKAKAEKEAEKTAAHLKRMRKSQAEQEFNIWLSEKLDIEIWREYEEKHNPAQDGAKSNKLP